MKQRKSKQTIAKHGIYHSFRKIINLSGTMVVSLPKEWCIEHNIKPGDEFSMTANNMVSMVKSPQ